VNETTMILMVGENSRVYGEDPPYLTREGALAISYLTLCDMAKGFDVLSDYVGL
jgi:hypothetical protein